MAVGAGIALILQEPLLALPLAFLSHFVLDSLPHYGIVGDEGYYAIIKYPQTKVMVALDLVGSIVLLILLRNQPWYVFAAMFLAVSPDFIWLYRYFWFEKKGKKPPLPGPLTKFHQKIQWGERIWGVYVELPVALILITLIWRNV